MFYNSKKQPSTPIITPGSNHTQLLLAAQALQQRQQFSASASQASSPTPSGSSLNLLSNGSNSPVPLPAKRIKLLGPLTFHQPRNAGVFLQQPGTTGVLLQSFPSTQYPLQPISTNTLPTNDMSGTGRNTINSKGLKGRKRTPGEDEKENVRDTSAGVPPLPEGGTPPPATTGNPVADVVIDHFTQHWETFKQGFKMDLDLISTTLNDPTVGLVTRVTNCETVTANLHTRVQTLEAAPKPVPGGPAPLTPALENCLAKVEKLCSDSEETGFLTRLCHLDQKLQKVAEIKEDGEIILTSPDIQELRADVSLLRKDVDTISGFMHVMSRELKAVDHRATMNAAKLIRNNLIFGGVRSNEDQPAEDALTAFLTNILQVPPGQDDIIEAEKLGKGYSRWVDGEELHLPPPIRARCMEVFAAKVMRNAPSLWGKKDEVGKFKYYVRHSMPEAHRAVRDKHYEEIKIYKDRNYNRQEGEPRTDFYFNGTKFFVNGEVVEEDITPPSFRDMLLIDEEMQERIDDVQFCMAGPKEEK